ncbi:hypothetical protein [Cytobacillus sp. IB215316]|nr:hypothetical protein [Cytobacillus sp. IB215316]
MDSIAYSVFTTVQEGTSERFTPNGLVAYIGKGTEGSESTVFVDVEIIR